MMKVDDRSEGRIDASDLGCGRIRRQACIAIAVALALSAASAAPRCVYAQAARNAQIAVAGDTLRLFPVSAQLRATLARDIVPSPDSIPLVVPFLEWASGETLAFGAPVLTFPLPGRAVEFIPPRADGEPAYLLTRAGVVRFHPDAPSRRPEVLLPGWDLVSGTVRADGTLLLLERTFDEQGGGALPAHLLAIDPGRSEAFPDTAAVCAAGSMRILAAPGDTLLWITRFNGRTADRLALRDGRWRRMEISIVPKAGWREERWNLRQGFVSPEHGVLVVDAGRGARPRLLAIDAWGGPQELYTWKRGVQPLNGSFAPGGGFLMLNAITNLSLLDLERKAELSFALPLLVLATALSRDGNWVLTAAQSREAPRSEIQLRRRGSPRAAEVWVNETIYAATLLE